MTKVLAASEKMKCYKCKSLDLFSSSDMHFGKSTMLVHTPFSLTIHSPEVTRFIWKVLYHKDIIKMRNWHSDYDVQGEIKCLCRNQNCAGSYISLYPE